MENCILLGDVSSALMLNVFRIQWSYWLKKKIFFCFFLQCVTIAHFAPSLLLTRWLISSWSGAYIYSNVHLHPFRKMFLAKLQGRDFALTFSFCHWFIALMVSTCTKKELPHILSKYTTIWISEHSSNSQYQDVDGRDYSCTDLGLITQGKCAALLSQYICKSVQ